MFNRILKVQSLEHLNDSYFVIGIHLDSDAQDILPGQFFELKNPAFSHPMLRKPISVYDVQGNTVFFMVKKLGKGTEQLSLLKAGDNLDLLGPLGNGFPLTEGSKALLVSGGIGYPPMLYLKKQLEAAGKSVYWIHGGRCEEDVFPADETWTDDGSCGKRGFVSEGLTAYLEQERPDSIYACGPQLMLKACHQITAKHNITLYVSLEEYMACGIGVCHGCAVKVKADSDIGVTYKTVCKDGPVFDSREIVWE
jgi:dihydroorotate dehydrogenase electron transfer subunit